MCPDRAITSYTESKIEQQLHKNIEKTWKRSDRTWLICRRNVPYHVLNYTVPYESRYIIIHRHDDIGVQ